MYQYKEYKQKNEFTGSAQQLQRSRPRKSRRRTSGERFGLPFASITPAPVTPSSAVDGERSHDQPPLPKPSQSGPSHPGGRQMGRKRENHPNPAGAEDALPRANGCSFTPSMRPADTADVGIHSSEGDLPRCIHPSIHPYVRTCAQFRISGMEASLGVSAAE